MPTQKELLESARLTDAAINLHTMKIGKAILSVPPQELAPVPPVHELKLLVEDDDPFNGNINNRRVAERIAAQKKTIYTNPHRIIHSGDPNKAADDIAKSKLANPDALSESEKEEAANTELAELLRGKTPSAGSPAAAKSENATNVPSLPAAPATAKAPTAWMPGASK